MAGIFLLGAAPVGATGRASLNVGYTSGEMFANFIKTWSGTPGNPGLLDVNQYPNGGTLAVAITGNISLPTTYAGSYVLKWQGTGGIQLVIGGSPAAVISANNGSAFITELGTSGTGTVNNNLTASGTNGRIVFSFSAGAIAGVSTGFPSGFSYSGMGKATLCRLADEAIVDADENALNPDFIASLVAIKSRNLRTMDWNSTNGSNITKHSQRLPTTAFAFYQNWIPGVWGGTTSGTNTYTCANPTNSGSGAYVDGETVQVAWGITSTSGTITLQLAARGAKPILNNQGSVPGVGFVAPGFPSTLVFSTILDSWICWSGSGLTAGVPVEVQVALCNQVNQNLWHCWPHLFLDAEVSANVAYVASNLRAGLNAYFEYSNEVWNFGNTQTQLSHALGLSLGFADNNNRAYFHDWYGLRVRMMMALATTAWGGRSGLYRVMGIQQYLNTGDTDTYRFKGTDLITGNATYNTYTGSTSYNVSPNRPVDFIDVFSYAPYYNGAQIGSAFDSGYGANFSLTRGGPDANLGVISQGLKGAADAYFAGGSTNINAALAFVDWDVIQGIATDTNLAVTIAGNPGAATFTKASSSLANGEIVEIATNGTLPTGLTEGKNYFVINAASTTFQVSLTQGGAAVTISSAGSGTHFFGRSGTGLTLNVQNTLVNPPWETVFATYTGKTVECYEGGLQILAPTEAFATGTLGLPAGYGGLTGKIENLLTAYKHSALCKATVLLQFTQLGAFAHPVRPCWYTYYQDTVQFNSPWSLFESDIYSLKYTSYDALVQYNS